MNDSRYKIDFPSLKRLYNYNCPNIIEVNEKSPLLLRKSVQLCARYFLREGYSGLLHYDLVGDDATAFLFGNSSINYPHAIGACCFRLEEYTNLSKPIWEMHWAWIHPYERNKGLLSDHVDFFNERFGYWYPQTPHSKAMKAFIKKHNLKSPFELNLHIPKI